MTRLREALWILFAAAAGLVWVGVSSSLFYLLVLRGDSFDAAAWKSARSTPYSLCEGLDRDRMVDDLRDNHLHDGTTAGRVRALLGAPTSRYDENRWERGREVWVYVTDASWFDCMQLKLTFVNGRLVRTSYR